MSKIHVLDKTTIEQIAAGEVVERPFNVVKELVENSIDAGSSNISVEIKDGGLSLIRVTDDGNGISKDDIKNAFLPHATSKIVNIDDLLSVRSLGFRGEALSSISAVSDVELITKTPDDLTGSRYIYEKDSDNIPEDIGAPNGTTMIVRNLFYNVPARKKFLKSLSSEGSMVSDLCEHIALSHPEIAIKLISNGKTLFQTSGSGDLKEVIYRIYGLETAQNLIPFVLENDLISAEGYLGKPTLNRSNRNYETFFMNGRYVHCDVISKAVEEGCREYLMQHKFPFCVIHFKCDPKDIDVNVHPAKMEIRLHKREDIFDIISDSVRECMRSLELIKAVPVIREEDNKKNEVSIPKAPEPFETKRILNFKHVDPDEEVSNVIKADNVAVIRDVSQMNLFEDKFLSQDSMSEYKIIGQLFKTYWLIEYRDTFYMMDQHAAHEKVKFERLMAAYRSKTVTSQSINPPIIIDVNLKEADIINEYIDEFNKLGIEIEDFGSGSIAIRSMPQDLYGCDEHEFFREILDELNENPLKGDHEVILNKIASMSCKAAVKGNTEMNLSGIKALLRELMSLDNPYNCPHGRPTLISFSKSEIEKKFGRIVT
ncbi:MAG: DNA mismatch repair endonuclease MutL [Lachnospiraceae bacterium]|nr:DNA mismatch repair endonuclease MutL [Lachnospiraceae bacterium]